MDVVLHDLGCDLAGECAFEEGAPTAPAASL